MAFRRSTVRSRSAPPEMITVPFFKQNRGSKPVSDRTVDLRRGFQGAKPPAHESATPSVPYAARTVRSRSAPPQPITVPFFKQNHGSKHTSDRTLDVRRGFRGQSP